MQLDKRKFKIHPPSTGIGLLILALTQLPFAFNESLKIVCFATTFSDYATFWSWNDVPIDSRVRYCQGISIAPLKINDKSSQ